MALANSFGFRAGQLLLIEFFVLRSNMTCGVLSFFRFHCDCIFYGLGSFGLTCICSCRASCSVCNWVYDIIGNWKHSMIISVLPTKL